MREVKEEWWSRPSGYGATKWEWWLKYYIVKEIRLNEQDKKIRRQMKFLIVEYLPSLEACELIEQYNL
jgi:hypothetical protein